MANFKVTYIFGAGKQGWTESFYTGNISLTAAKDQASNLALVRIPMLAQGALLEAFRISEDEVRGDSELVRLTGATNEALQRAVPRDYQNTALLGEAFSTQLYRRQVWVRGIPDEWTIFNPTTGTFSPVAQALQIFTAYGQVITEGNWALKAVNKDAAIVRQQEVIDVVVDGPYFTFTVPLHGFAVGDKVKVSRAKGINMQYVNKLFQIKTVTANSFNVLHNLPIGTGIIYTKDGIVRRQVPTFARISRVQYVGVSSHDTGRAFFVRRGRRRVQR